MLAAPHLSSESGASAEAPFDSLSGKGGTVLPSQPETKVHIEGPPWEVDRARPKEPCSRSHHRQEFPQDPRHPRRSEVRGPWAARCGDMEAPLLLWVAPRGVSRKQTLLVSAEQPSRAVFLPRCPRVAPASLQRPHSRAWLGLGKCGARGAGAAGAARKEPLTHSYRKSGAGGARSTNCPPAGAGVGAWVGFKFRRGCDCKARKLQESSD